MGWREYQDSTPTVKVVKVVEEKVGNSHKPLKPHKPPAGDLKKQVDDRELFLQSLDADERIAYGELTEIMTSDGSHLRTPWTPEEVKKYRLTPEQAHKEAKAIIERYRNNQLGRGTHERAN